MTPSSPLRLDSAQCDRCGRCLDVCSARAVRIGPGYVAVDWGRCDGCLRCAKECLAGAIAVRGASPVVSRASSEDGSTAADTARAPWWRFLRKSPAPARRSGAAWSLAEAALVLAVAFALLVGVQSFVAVSAGAPWTGIAMLAYDAALVGLLWYLARRNGSDPSHAYRIDSAPEWWSVPLAIGVAVACWLFSVTYRAIVLAAGLQPGGGEGADLTGLFGAGPFGAFLTVAAVAVLGPALEELLLRGVVLDALRRRMPGWAAIVGTAVAFAALHASLWSMLPLTVLGLGLGWLATKSRSLWPAIVAHVMYNGVLVGAVLYTAGR